MSLMPSCREVTEKASEYVDKELSFWQRMGFAVHLFICVHCRRYVKQLRLTIGALGKLQQENDSPRNEEEVNNIVQQLKQHACKSNHKH
jgi:hypothetical protein